MNAILSFRRTAALVTGLALASTFAGVIQATESDSLSDFDNYIKFSGYHPSVSGSDAAYQRRMQVQHQGAAGIEDARLEYSLPKDFNLTIDGKALFGAEDYRLAFTLSKDEVGSFGAGYQRFRTFYDGAGGFFPLNDAWMPLYPRSRYVDRSKFFVDAKIALPKAPVFEFHYTDERREGYKDSTIWGDTDFTGIPIYSQSSLNPVTATRKILPAYLHLDERHQEWEFTIRHTVGNSTGSISVIGSKISNLDYRTVDRYTGELKPYPAIPSTPVTLVDPSKANNPNSGLDIEGFDERALTYLAKFDTKLTDWATIYVEGSYRHSSGETSASRLINATLATVNGPVTGVGGYAVGQRPPYSYTAAGTLRTDTTTGVFGLRLTPLSTLSLNLGVRGEHATISANSTAAYVSTLITPKTGVVKSVPVGGPNWSRIDEKPWTPEVDVRYSGIHNLALYANWDYRSVTEDERTAYTAFTVNTSTGVLTAPLNLGNDAIKEKHSNFVIGANWTPTLFLTVRPEFFTKDHENNFTGYASDAGSYYYLDYDIYGARISAIVKPLSVLTFNTRYIVQRGKAMVEADGFGAGESNDARRYQICETIDWVPLKSVYVQVNANVVWDTIRTAYPTSSGAALGVIRNADNNYWNGSVIAGFVLGPQTDLQLESTYYKANNYNPALAATTEPFSMTAREVTFNAGVKHKFTDRIIASAKVGYFDSTNATAGGNSDFHGPLAYVSLEYKL